ncbi:MAG: PH domain-containing protein [Lacunisphaera sp.]
MNDPAVDRQIQAIERPDKSLLKYYLLSCLTFPPLLLIAGPYLYFRYHTMRYKFTDDGISMSWGILFRREIIVNYARIQDIHLKSNIVERWLGLARILVQTASGSGSAEMTIEGLKEFEALRDFLYARMRGVKDPHVHPAAPVVAGAAGDSRPTRGGPARNRRRTPRRARGTGRDPQPETGLKVAPLKITTRQTPANPTQASQDSNPMPPLFSFSFSPRCLAFGILTNMYQRLTQALLRLLKVPHEPTPPHGNPASLRVFRAGHNFFKLKLFGWGLTQLLAFAGLLFWLFVFLDVEGTVERRRGRQVPVSPAEVKNFDEYMQRVEAAQKPAEVRTAQADPAAPAKKRPRVRITGWAGFKQMLVQLGLWLPAWSFPVLWALKILGFLVYLVQLPVTFLILRLDYELRWYMVTDRSLRIRHGVWKISESTMSFANIQQVIVSQGPLQRALGLADVKVQSAGGGGESDHHHNGGEDMHLGLFHSVTNAPEIRDLILERLRHFRESGLGDPDEKRPPAMPPPAAARAAPADVLAAARELLAEAKALRATLS